MILFSSTEFTQVFKDASAVGNKEYMWYCCVVMEKLNHKGFLVLRETINNRAKVRNQKTLALSVCWNQRVIQLPNNFPL